MKTPRAERLTLFVQSQKVEDKKRLLAVFSFSFSSFFSSSLLSFTPSSFHPFSLLRAESEQLYLHAVSPTKSSGIFLLLTFSIRCRNESSNKDNIKQITAEESGR